MRRSASGALFRLLGLASLVALSAPAAIITFSTSLIDNSGPNPIYRYTYNLTGAQITTNQEIDIRFNASQYGTLSNGQPSSNPNFSLLLFQPNTPPGAFGDYSLVALVTSPSMVGTFTVDFVWLGSGTPGSQPFFINQLDSLGGFVSQLESGTTQSSVPEPSTLLIGGTALVALGLLRQSRQRRRTTDTSR